MTKKIIKIEGLRTRNAKLQGKPGGNEADCGEILFLTGLIYLFGLRCWVPQLYTNLAG